MSLIYFKDILITCRVIVPACLMFITRSREGGKTLGETEEANDTALEPGNVNRDRMYWLRHFALERQWLNSRKFDEILVIVNIHLTYS